MLPYTQVCVRQIAWKRVRASRAVDQQEMVDKTEKSPQRQNNTLAMMIIVIITIKNNTEWIRSRVSDTTVNKVYVYKRENMCVIKWEKKYNTIYI